MGQNPEEEKRNTGEQDGTRKKSNPNMSGQNIEEEDGSEW